MSEVAIGQIVRRKVMREVVVNFGTGETKPGIDYIACEIVDFSERAVLVRDLIDMCGGRGYHKVLWENIER